MTRKYTRQYAIPRFLLHNARSDTIHYLQVCKITAVAVVVAVVAAAAVVVAVVLALAERVAEVAATAAVAVAAAVQNEGEDAVLPEAAAQQMTQSSLIELDQCLPPVPASPDSI